MIPKGENAMKKIVGLVMAPMVTLALGLSGCLELGTTEGGGGGQGSNSSSGGFTSGGGTSGCDAAGTSCDVCSTCAANPVNGACVFEVAACNSVPQCAQVNVCIQACPPNDTVCGNQCMTTFPIGAEVYLDYFKCIYCQHCSNSCKSTMPCE